MLTNEQVEKNKLTGRKLDEHGRIIIAENIPVTLVGELAKEEEKC